LVFCNEKRPSTVSVFDSHENAETLSHGALRHELAKRLLIEIFQGKMPEGTRLIAMNLAARFGVSSTPVREALFELEASEVIEVIHNRGAIVKRFGREELREIFHIRGLIESEAARLACTRIDKDVLDGLCRSFTELAKRRPNAKWFELEMAVDRELHAIIAANCGNSRLAKEFERYNMLVEALRTVVGNERRAVRDAVTTHLAIVDAMLARDPAAAGAAMAHHIELAGCSAELAIFGKESPEKKGE
jgi:DNA-binding GntR family transcriptional regulator